MYQTVGSNSAKINLKSSYDSLELQKDLIKILGNTSSVFTSNVPDLDSLRNVFTALDRLCQINGNLQYYFQLMNKILKQSVYCRQSDIPEVVYDQIGGQTPPFFQVKDELLICLNKVIRKAQ